MDYALSREQKNKKGGKMYIQDKVRLAASARRFDLICGGGRVDGAALDATTAQRSTRHLSTQVEEYADEIFERLQNGAVMYFCGLKGMMPGIQDMLKEVCRKKGKTYDDFVADLKKKGQWRVEVY